MPARSCPTCQSIGTRRLVAHDGQGTVPCPDPWHVPTPRDDAPADAHITTASLPPGSDPDRGRPGIHPSPGTPRDAITPPLTVTDRTAELARESLGQPMARRIDALCRMLAEEEARRALDKQEAHAVHAMTARVVERRGRIIKELRAELAQFREDLRLANGGYDLTQATSPAPAPAPCCPHPPSDHGTDGCLHGWGDPSTPAGGCTCVTPGARP